LENEIQNLDSRVEELKSEVRDLEDAESERDNYYDNLVEIKAKIEEVYALVECAESFKALDHTISYLIEYFNDEVSGL
jgi:prefoldin subunit 5